MSWDVDLIKAKDIGDSTVQLLKDRDGYHIGEAYGSALISFASLTEAERAYDRIVDDKSLTEVFGWYC